MRASRARWARPSATVRGKETKSGSPRPASSSRWTRESETIGMEIAGEVLKPDSRRGEKVMALIGGGGYAERARVPAAQAMPVPPGLSFAEAAAIPEAFFTSWLNLMMLGRLQAGEV